MILKNLCDSCKKTFCNCNGKLEDMVFAGDIFKLPDITIKQLDCVIECKGYVNNNVIYGIDSTSLCNKIIDKLKEDK